MTQDKEEKTHLGNGISLGSATMVIILGSDGLVHFSFKKRYFKYSVDCEILVRAPITAFRSVQCFAARHLTSRYSGKDG